MMTFGGGDSLRWVVALLSLAMAIVHRVSLNSVSATCELSVVDRNKLYNYSLALPIPRFPHGVLSEDGFYKVQVNETVLWFQLCDAMIFNHYPPTCVDCQDCGGPSRCGMGCSALVSNKIAGYPVCTTIGHTSSMGVHLIDEKDPHAGVTVKMSNGDRTLNCSLAVSVICDSSGVQGPQTLETVGTCNYATVLRHPSGCANVVSVHGQGLGWFGTFIIVILCLFGGYLLSGIVYRFFYLGVRGIDLQNRGNKVRWFQIWKSGPAYHIELRVFTCPCCGNSEDLLKVIEVPILVSTFECQLPSNFCCEVFFNRSGFTVRILQTNAIRVIGICEQRGYSSPTFAVILLGFLILALGFGGYVACYVPKSVGFTTEQSRLK
ncbi:hypothetical protein RHGRI_008079 [Rhododendron griersonianum]|uniref:Uncharacterized protein n=2 Tax=Rhododendron TaxID=4346 RepID=A0AAV6KZB2_9ERIC|nr:hypothetical protein RHGRI_008079 [Rhododendron griersonianum]